MPRIPKFATPAEFEAEYRRLKAIPLPSRGKPKTDERQAWERARNARRYAKACAFEGPEARRKRLDRRNDLQRERMNIRNNQVVNTGPSDERSDAIGLFIFSSSDSVVEGNVISSVSATGASFGIIVQNSDLIVVRNNTVLRTEDATNNRGIALSNATDVTIIGNRILNPTTTGDFGITDLGGSTGVNCIENVVAGYTTPVSGCDFVSGNLTP